MTTTAASAGCSTPHVMADSDGNAHVLIVATAVQRQDVHQPAMIVNMGLAQLLLAVILLGSMVLAWPDVPWVGVASLSAGAMIALPTWFYPRSKTIWVWLDATVHPYEPEERDWER